jgi:hypothetical protein
MEMQVMATFIEPFVAARLERATEEARSEELTQRGIRFLKQNGLMAWDGRDLERGLDLATIAYNATLRDIARASGRLAA